MTLRELKEWIEKLPEECLEYSIVHAEVSDLATEDDEDGESSFSIRLDKPITALSVDEENGEILIMNDYDDSDDYDAKEFMEGKE
jgi:hypothetical protein